MNQGGIVPSKGEMKARLLEERVSALETKVAELSTTTNNAMEAIAFVKSVAKRSKIEYAAHAELVSIVTEAGKIAERLQ